MDETPLLYDLSDGIATITLNRPAALNALLPEMGDQLAALVDRAEADDAVRVIVLTGAGRAFSAGADLKLMGRADRLGRFTGLSAAVVMPLSVPIRPALRPLMQPVHGGNRCYHRKANPAVIHLLDSTACTTANCPAFNSPPRTI